MRLMRRPGYACRTILDGIRTFERTRRHLPRPLSMARGRAFTADTLAFLGAQSTREESPSQDPRMAQTVPLGCRKASSSPLSLVQQNTSPSKSYKPSRASATSLPGLLGLLQKLEANTEGALARWDSKNIRKLLWPVVTLFCLVLFSFRHGPCQSVCGEELDKLISHCALDALVTWWSFSARQFQSRRKLPRGQDWRHTAMRCVTEER